jgi:hypothetical protein
LHCDIAGVGQETHPCRDQDNTFLHSNVFQKQMVYRLLLQFFTLAQDWLRRACLEWPLSREFPVEDTSI